MEYFIVDAPYAPTTPTYFPNPWLFYFQLLMLVLALLSAVMHSAFILSIRQLCDIGASSAYLILGILALLGFGYSISIAVVSFLSLIGLRWNDCIVVWRMSGGVFITTIISMNFLHFYLLSQRIICIFFPLRVRSILCRSVILISCFFIVFFYILLIALCLSPYVGIAYVPEHGMHALLKQLPYTVVLSSANQFTNYAVMLSNVTAYPTLLLILKFKQQTHRKLDEEIRLTAQITLSVGIEVAFFMMWEFVDADGLFVIVLFEISDMCYYNAVTFPYFLMNKRVQKQIKRLFSHGRINPNTALFKRRNLQKSLFSCKNNHQMTLFSATRITQNPNYLH